MKVGEFVTDTLCFIGCLLVCASSTKFTVSTHDTVYSCTKPKNGGKNKNYKKKKNIGMRLMAVRLP